MPEVSIELPTFHPGQVAALRARTRYSVLRCGRRFGKTELLGTVGCLDVIQGKFVGYFAPDYKRLSPFYKWIKERLKPIITQSTEMGGVIRCVTGGEIEFWTLNDDSAGRSRKYHTSLIDESAFTGPNMMDIWRGSIKPTLLDYRGRCIVSSNTNGIDSEQFFWKICNEKEHGFGPENEDGTFGFHATSYDNPYMPTEDLEELRRTEHPLVFRQEYLAEFVDWSGVAFFSLDKMLVNDKPIPQPKRVDGVFCTIDTATKTGSGNDGTAVIWWGINRLGDNFPLCVLDWDIVQIEGASLENWLPSVFQIAEGYAKDCRSRGGFLGAWIEDKSSGMVLLQHARNRGWPAHPIESKLTSMGKDERVFSVSSYFTQMKVKLSEHAYTKVVTYKGTTRNHLISQVTGFRIGDKDASKRADDLLDCFTYGLAIGLGNDQGF